MSERRSPLRKRGLNEPSRAVPDDDAKRNRLQLQQESGGDHSQVVTVADDEPCTWPLDDDTTWVVMRFLENKDRLRLRLVCPCWSRVGRLAVDRVSFRMKEGEGWAAVGKRLDVFRGVRNLKVLFVDGSTVGWGADFAAAMTDRRLVALDLR